LLAFVPSPGNEELVEGVCKGVITESPRGLNGFGYDPVFQPVGYSETFAEMSASLKNEISHRGRALKELKAILPKYFVGS
jgi:XTP/dITP diphosphohydrolase